MSMLADMAFGAIDHFIKEEANKQIDRYVNSATLNGVLTGLGVWIPALTDVSGKFKVQITEIVVGYTGTAMKKVQDRVTKMPDREINLDLQKTFAAMPAKDGPSAEISFSIQPNIRNIGFSQSMGGIKAEITSLSFRLSVSGTAASRIKA